MAAVDSLRLSRVDFLFPRESPEDLSFFESIVSLVGQAPGAQRLESEVVFTPANPPNALPYSSLRLGDVELPEIVLETDRLIDVRVGRLRLRSSVVPHARGRVALGEAWRDCAGLAVGELGRQLDGHVTGIDHMGVNLPADIMDRSEWNRLLRELAVVSSMYRYPTGEEWRFVIPATQEELAGEIVDFVLGRAPKFELVYDSRPVPLLQFAVKTDLDQEQSARMFPEPSGCLLPKVGQFFRSIYVAHPWPELEIRFDLYYRNEEGSSTWDTCEMLVAGGRER